MIIVLINALSEHLKKINFVLDFVELIPSFIIEGVIANALHNIELLMHVLSTALQIMYSIMMYVLLLPEAVLWTNIMIPLATIAIIVDNHVLPVLELLINVWAASIIIISLITHVSQKVMLFVLKNVVFVNSLINVLGVLKDMLTQVMTVSKILTFFKMYNYNKYLNP